MKIRKIIDICKRSGYILLFEGGSEQWISDGAAVYPMYGIPKFEQSTLYATYDITGKQAGKIIFRHERNFPILYDFSDVIAGENIVQSGQLCITDAGRTLIPYATSQGVMFIDAKYLRPLEDIEGDMLEMYERHDANGQIYFAAKTGFMLVAIIMPVDVINPAFVGRLKELADQCDVALYNKRSAERAKSVAQKSIFGEAEDTVE